VEWPERLGDALPSPRLDVRIAVTGDQQREIRIETVGEGLERYIEAARR
jgi:tRNA A37 threonylcarbamoyladenosine biosynthesis protein TsaE